MTHSTPCNTLQHTATHCNTMQHTATQVTCVAVCCRASSVSFFPTMIRTICFSVLQCVAVCCSTSSVPFIVSSASSYRALFANVPPSTQRAYLRKESRCKEKAFCTREKAHTHTHTFTTISVARCVAQQQTPGRLYMCVYIYIHI